MTENISRIDHVVAAWRCVNFAAPPRPILPYRVRPGELVIEFLTGGKVWFEGEIFTTGAVFVHLEGEDTIHRSVDDAFYRCLVVKFHVSEKRRFMPRQVQWRDPDSFAPFVADVMRFWNEGGTDPEIFKYYVLGTLLRRTLEPVSAPLPAPLRKACSVLNERWHESGAVIEAVARECGVSRTGLFRLFRAHLACTPRQYLERRRMEAAALLLTGSDTPVKEIADYCGFENLEVFYRCFKRCYKVTPGNYRCEG